jgi:hypothetical protein
MLPRSIEAGSNRSPARSARAIGPGFSFILDEDPGRFFALATVPVGPGETKTSLIKRDISSEACVAKTLQGNPSVARTRVKIVTSGHASGQGGGVL